MNQTDITISFQLQILADKTVIIPGCEPTSALSSASLSYSLSLNGCKNPKIPVSLILEKIPGTYIKYGWDFNLGYNQTWLVFPPYYTGCPCPYKPDWYDMLRCIAKDIPIEETRDESCDILEREFCNPDIQVGGGKPENADAYQVPPEGPSAIGYGGILPPIPPWARKTVNFCKLANMPDQAATPNNQTNNILDSILG